jgi:tetratricopeptide (TPR) repeat protein
MLSIIAVHIASFCHDPGRKRMRSSPNWAWILLCFILLSLHSACVYSKKATVASTAALLEEVAKSSSRQSDLRLIREGTPAFLMLMDGMIEALPDSAPLLLAAARAYSSYASTFVDEEDQEYAKVLLKQAKDYALRALEIRGLRGVLQSPLEEFKEALKNYSRDDLPYLFWGASCWAGWIGHHLDSVEALADLPRVEWMMRRSLEIDEGFYYGGPHLFMGIWYASRPKMAGGDLAKAREHFLKAIDLGHGEFLMASVYFAQHYARQTQDKDLFVSTLQKVLETPAHVPPELTLVNTVAKKRAQQLLGRVDEFFE